MALVSFDLEIGRDLRWTRTTILILTGAGGLGLTLLSLTAQGNALLVLGSGLLVASAAFAVGGLIGFLFAIPRAPGPGTAPAATPPRPSYQLNTNLEQISDWLTKILVGASLTQVNVILEAMRRGAKTIAAGTGPPIGEAVAWALIVHFAASGFLAGYLFTALFLGGALARAQHDAGKPIEDLDVRDKRRLTDSIEALSDLAKGQQALKELGVSADGMDSLDAVKAALQVRVRRARSPAEIAMVGNAFRKAGILSA